MLPLTTLLTSADTRTAADDIWQRILVSHLYKQFECMLPLPTLLTSADGTTVADDIWHSEFLLSWPTLLTSADGRIVVRDVRQQIIVSPP